MVGLYLLWITFPDIIGIFSQFWLSVAVCLFFAGFFIEQKKKESAIIKSFLPFLL